MNIFKQIFCAPIILYNKIVSSIKEYLHKLELRKQKITYIKINGPYITAVRNLNNYFKFKNIESHPRFERSCNSKAQLDNFNIDNHILSTIEQSPDYFVGMVKAAKYNKINYSKYLMKYDAIIKDKNLYRYYQKVSIPSVIEAEELYSIEIDECQKIKKRQVVTDFTLELIIYYTSPQRRNSYSRTYRFSCSDIEYYLDTYNTIQKNKQSAAYQRQIMTPKLRYKIMQRDGFKCVLCGRSQKDGAKLHVDHIKPVSKGGKTEESNLRTLCDKCNLGKSNMYTLNGLN